MNYNFYFCFINVPQFSSWASSGEGNANGLPAQKKISYILLWTNLIIYSPLIREVKRKKDLQQAKNRLPLYTFNYKGNFLYSLLTGIPLSMLPIVSQLVYSKVMCE